MDRELENLSNEKLYEKYNECISNIYNTNDDIIKDENKKIIDKIRIILDDKDLDEEQING